MEINIASPHFDLSEKRKAKIEHKIALLKKFYQRITACDIIVSDQGDEKGKKYCIEAKMLLPQRVLFVKESAADFDKALYQSIKKILHQLKQYKERQEAVR
ncbi:ribosome hibernation-promoting factor, HPF/YfiA family [Parafilimonas sp.]|uniref:ribosome hibernation-promoting factor, HPF/YfiA family n=1 Tax=Parafilimonas sp. TaxID=1969739 RepID=UPI003F7E2E06